MANKYTHHYSDSYINSTDKKTLGSKGGMTQ